MWRFALSRRWWAGHVLVAVGCVLFLGLARWQWDRSQSITGDWQNLGYALQWPLFAVFLVVAWLRFLWLEQHSGAARRASGDASAVPRPAGGGAPGHLIAPETAPGHPGAPGCPGEPTPAHPPNSEDDPDDELAAYNAYLARLADEDRRR